ncbi:iron uptake porin [Leptothoe spongobia]|uniref:Iron uptake porin n=1 Tax=Leptothoe spongobia TAU-MAC 1115 TaxID=1967444 RepID=A0A947DJ28_9CYAN|nr:iron uptake porin [Leptothoe spongobia]MBT9317189.1 iron uptake porin [Leptothoe spongobia TAU-MAC 1115]
MFLIEYPAPLNYLKPQPVIAQSLINSDSDTPFPLVSELEELLHEQDNIGSQVDALENRVSDLQEKQVSPVVTLSGEAIFGISDATGNDINEGTRFNRSIELIFGATLTGEDYLEIGIEAGNAGEFSFNDEITAEGQLSFLTDTEDNVELSELSYEFPMGDRGTVFISATGDDLDDFHPLLDDDLTGAISEFGSENPIHSLVDDVGIQLNYELTDDLDIGVGYFTENASNSSEGLFNGNNSAFVQVGYEPSDSLLLGFTYVYTDNDSSLETDTGSFRSQVDLEQPVIGNSYGFAGSWAPNEWLTVGGWVGYTNARVIDEGDAYILNYALTLAFPDLGKEDNLLGLMIGQEPKLMGTGGFTIDDRRSDPDTSLHIEAFYTHQLNDYLSITPGFIWLTAPDHNNDNDDIILFTVRTAFEF